MAETGWVVHPIIPVESKLSQFVPLSPPIWKNSEGEHEAVKLKLIFHALGISVIFVALLLELFMLCDIATTGYFRAVEKNPVILSIEFILLFFGIVYTIHLLKVIKTLFIEESSEKIKTINILFRIDIVV